MTAICKLCKQSATFTYRHAGSEVKRMIGGEELYMPLCRECHRRESKLNKKSAYVGDPSITEIEVEKDMFFGLGKE